MDRDLQALRVVLDVRWENASQEMGVLDAAAIADVLDSTVQDLVDPRPSLRLLRDSPLCFLSPSRIERIRSARQPLELVELLQLEPSVGVVVQPADVPVSSEQFAAAQEEASATFRRRASGRLAKILQRLGR